MSSITDYNTIPLAELEDIYQERQEKFRRDHNATFVGKCFRRDNSHKGYITYGFAYEQAANGDLIGKSINVRDNGCFTIWKKRTWPRANDWEIISRDQLAEEVDKTILELLDIRNNKPT